jgi:hypothetical protein
LKGRELNVRGAESGGESTLALGLKGRESIVRRAESAGEEANRLPH